MTTTPKRPDVPPGCEDDGCEIIYPDGTRSAELFEGDDDARANAIADAWCFDDPSGWVAWADHETARADAAEAALAREREMAAAMVSERAEMLYDEHARTLDAEATRDRALALLREAAVHPSAGALGWEWCSLCWARGRAPVRHESTCILRGEA